MSNVVNLFGETEDEDLIEEEPSAPAARPGPGIPPTAETTRGIEQMVERPPGADAPPPSLQLLSVFGDNGRVRVALAVNGQRVEEWRDPTEKEWVQLRERGRLIRGGIGQAPVQPSAAQQVPAPTPPSTGLPLGKLLVGGLALAGVGAALYFWHQNKQMNENLEEVD